ncbi:hypothetical protein SpCBS45565_g01407 [Spizellomyces sp. 'palustris']|nr:hypothetical protein SpCBS45565_g01407 [Spizellomyces sp. 'palustris']
MHTTFFHGPRSARFRTLPPVTGDIGPGGYDVDQTTTFTSSHKPISKLGLCVRTSQRFRTPSAESPGVGTYDPPFLNTLDKPAVSKLGILASKSPKSSLESQLTQTLTLVPGPGTYDINYAIGRHVFNDDRFRIYKSDKILERDEKNKTQLAELRKLLGAGDLFTDKRACRRMAHLALYY